MADEDMDAAGQGSWWRGWASAGAVVATLLLVALVFMVALSNQARDRALAYERHTYDVMLLTRTVDATVARSEAALGRFVLDERRQSGGQYYSEWRLAGRQIGQLRRLVRDDLGQSARVEALERIYRERSRELAAAATAAASRKSSGGVPLFYQAGLSPTGPALRAELDAIARSERDQLRERMTQTRLFDAEADRLTGWLAWAGVLIGVAAIVLGLAAWRAISERLIARAEADSEASRAQKLDQAVQERTRELKEANDRLRAEGAERAAAEAQLRQVQKMEAVGQLTGGIAHDFNNMLAVVVGGVDLARRKLRGPRRDVEYHLDNAMEGATRAAALTRRLLAFSRSEQLLPKSIVPSELVEGMLDLIDRAIGERVAVQTRFPDEAWPVWADANQLENAILNLCVNARDAMNGQGELTIAVENVPLAAPQGELEPGDYVRISVVDSGSGIAPEHLERVFEPFFTTKPVGKGTGLGLSQIFGFARQSGGDVTIDSALGAGTTVALILPRSHRIEETEAGGAALPAGELAWAEAGTVVLVVEDDPRVSRSTVGALEELGYLPLACAGGAEALDILAANDRIELLITDVMMPEMTGPELVRIASERHPHVAVLFVTGFAAEEGELGDHATLRKPFTVAALAEAAAAALGRPVSEWPQPSTSAAAE